jgi:hypothetical protein
MPPIRSNRSDEEELHGARQPRGALEAVPGQQAELVLHIAQAVVVADEDGADAAAFPPEAAAIFSVSTRVAAPSPGTTTEALPSTSLSVTGFSSRPRASSGGPVFISAARCATAALPPVEQRERRRPVEQREQRTGEAESGGAGAREEAAPVAGPEGRLCSIARR